jgi:inner membrane protein
MNKNEHYTVAFIVLIVIYFLLDYINLIKFFGYAVTLIVGSVAPDILEPAKHYTHRKFFHSSTTLKYLTYSLIPLLIFSLIINNIFYIFFFVTGYIIHLLMDSTTKMGLPK